MSKRAWIHLTNPFEINTRGSHRKMLSLTTDTHSKLDAEKSDPDILLIFNDYDPVHAAYVSIYAQHDTVAGIRKGKTLNFETMMKETLLTELRKWEGAVRNFYVEDSPGELAIFPNKRKPFIKGTYEERINAVNGLKGRLADDGNFATLVTQVQSFYNTLLAARSVEQQKEGLLGQLADLREQQRVLTAQALDGFVLSGLKRKFRTDLSQVERFLDLSLLRVAGEDDDDDGEPSIPATSFVIKGKVTNALTEALLNNVTVFFAMPEGGPGFSAISNISGDYEFRIDNLPAHEVGTIGVSVNGFPGFQNFTQNQNVETGNVYTVDIALQPL